jgi:ribosome-associated heat shock protein Hsp15
MDAFVMPSMESFGGFDFDSWDDDDDEEDMND